MAQHDYDVGPGTGRAVRDDINAALAALVSTNLGPTAPVPAYEGQWWCNDSVDPWAISIRAGEGWRPFLTISPSTGAVVVIAGTGGLADEDIARTDNGGWVSVPAAADPVDLDTALGQRGVTVMAVSAPTGGPAGVASGVLSVHRAATDDVTQTLMAADGQTYTRVRTGSVWSAWVRGLGAADIATQAEAEAGTEAAKLMTPERTAQAIAAQAVTALGAGTNVSVVGASVSTTTVDQVSKSTSYTLVLADAGKHILHPSTDGSARTFTIPAHASVPYPVGTALTFVNQHGAGVVTIAITSDTMRLAGAGTTGSRTLAANGIATALKITATDWIISGGGLT